jgi:putative ABC transport system ATP-binding protein
MNKILELKNIKREFKMGSETVRALKDVSFAVEIGEFCSLWAPVDQGKPPC